MKKLSAAVALRRELDRAAVIAHARSRNGAPERLQQAARTLGLIVHDATPLYYDEPDCFGVK